MKTMKRVRVLLIVVIIILIVPVLLNYLLRMPVPFNIPIVGDEKAWLQFWGVYMGGILTASIGFLTLYVTNKRNCEQEVFKINEARAIELQDELIRRITTLNYYAIGRVLPRLQNGISKDEVLREVEYLKNKSEEAEMEGISWGLMAWHGLNSKPKGFDVLYTAQIVQFQADIRETIAILDDYCIVGEPNSERVAAMIDKLHKHQTGMVLSLCKPSKDWIAEETGC